MIKKGFLFAVCCMFSLLAWSKVYTPTTLPMVHLTDATRYVCNPDHILSPAAVSTMDSIFYALERQTGVETIVAVVEGIEPNDCFTFAHDLFTAQGVGKKGKDNGLVVLLSTDERCIQFVTGYGLEGTLPDAICKRIQNRYMNEDLAQGHWDKAMIAGSRALYGYLIEGEEAIASAPTEGNGSPIGFWVFILLFVLMFVISYISARRQTRCPKCKKHTLQRTDRLTISNVNGIRRDQVTYTCRNCGHTVHRIEEHHLRQNNGPRGPIVGGGRGFWGGGSMGGGSMGGGSFGGGRSGGGGAGSRF